MINNSQRHEEIKQWYEEIDLTNKNQTKTNEGMKNSLNVRFKLLVEKK